MWASVDPLAEMFPNRSPYEYCFQNPLKYIDPTGMAAEPPTEGEFENGHVHTDSDGSWTFRDGVWWDNSKAGNDIKHGSQQLQEVIISSPRIKSRDKWGASAPVIEPGRDFEKIDGGLAEYYDSIAIHHSGNSDSPTIKDIQRKHQKSGKADIGYHFAIDSNGVIYEGRPIGIVGSHIAMANSNVIGIVLLGDYHQEDIGNSENLTQKSLISLKNLIKYLHNKYDVSNGINGHNGFNCGGYTECPGNKLEKWIPIIAEKLGLPLAKCKTTGGDKLVPVN